MTVTTQLHLLDLFTSYVENIEGITSIMVHVIKMQPEKHINFMKIIVELNTHAIQEILCSFHSLTSA